MSTDKFTNGHDSSDGYATSNIYYDNEDKMWHLRFISNSSIFATTNASYTEYPFGTRKWQVLSGEVQGNFTLNLNGCNDVSQYDCHDGSCIGADKR